MSVFKERLTAPSTSDKYWIHTSKGGVNECILIGTKSCIPNCVGYAWGRAYEIMNARPNLCKGNAENWFIYNDGYGRGDTPKVGAIACWQKGEVRNGNDGAGHVAIVESIKSDGTIVTSNSGYKSTRFYIKEIKPPYSLNGYTFQGFIYLPIVTEEPKQEEVKQEDNTNQNVTNNTNYKVGDIVHFDYMYTDSYGNKKVKSAIHGGTITKIYFGRKAPYLINNGSGFVSDDLIINNFNNNTTLKNNYKVGDIVHFDYFYTDSYGSKKVKSAIHSGTITKIYSGRKAPYLINNGSGFVSDDLII